MTLPAHLQRYQAPDVAADLAKNLGSAMPPHVSIGGGRFTLIDASNAEIPVPTFDPQLGPYLDACIVDVADVVSNAAPVPTGPVRVPTTLAAVTVCSFTPRRRAISLFFIPWVSIPQMRHWEAVNWI